MKLTPIKALITSAIVAMPAKGAGTTQAVFRHQQPRALATRLLGIPDDTLTKGLEAIVVVNRNGSRTEAFSGLGINTIYQRISPDGLKLDNTFLPVPKNTKIKITPGLIGTDVATNLPIQGICVAFKSQNAPTPVLAPTDGILISKTSPRGAVGNRTIELFGGSGLHSYLISMLSSKGKIDLTKLGTRIKRGDTLGFALPKPGTDSFEVKMAVRSIPKGLHELLYKRSGFYGFVNPLDPEEAGNVAYSFQKALKK